MEEEILQKIEEQKQQIVVLVQEIAKLNRYFRLTFWITIALFVIPLIVAIFVIPAFLNTYLGSFNGLL